MAYNAAADYSKIIEAVLNRRTFTLHASDRVIRSVHQVPSSGQTKWTSWPHRRLFSLRCANRKELPIMRQAIYTVVPWERIKCSIFFCSLFVGGDFLIGRHVQVNNLVITRVIDGEADWRFLTTKNSTNLESMTDGWKKHAQELFKMLFGTCAAQSLNWGLSLSALSQFSLFRPLPKHFFENMRDVPDFGNAFFKFLVELTTLKRRNSSGKTTR